MQQIFPKTILILFTASMIACDQKQTQTTEEIVDTVAKKEIVTISVDSSEVKNTPAIPTDSLLGEAKGDLDKDGVEERVLIYNTSVKTEMGTERQIHILKKESRDWKLWHKSIGAVLASNHGGMMGDPFESIEIVKGCIVIHHFGGGRGKWEYTHRYRFQKDNWYLIGATIGIIAPCESHSVYDYNVSTGNIEVQLYKEACEDDKPPVVSSDKFSFVEKPKEPILMDGFYPGNNQVKVPRKDYSDFYY